MSLTLLPKSNQEKVHTHTKECERQIMKGSRRGLGRDSVQKMQSVIHVRLGVRGVIHLAAPLVGVFPRAVEGVIIVEEVGIGAVPERQRLDHLRVLQSISLLIDNLKPNSPGLLSCPILASLNSTVEAGAGRGEMGLQPLQQRRHLSGTVDMQGV